MADTRVQLEVEYWVRGEWLLHKYRQQFRSERVKLSSGGVFEFDAVSADNTIVATISTARAHTASGKLGVGKMMKIRSDMYFLMLAECQRRLVVLTERDMFLQFEKERQSGRVPTTIEFIHVEIPADLDAKLRLSRQAASKEVAPRKSVRR